MIHHRKIPRDAVHVGRKADGDIINATILMRRLPGHDPVPTYDDYIGCPKRERLPEDEFARRYGASHDDIALIKSHYEGFGIAAGHHMARRHVYLSGTAAQFNAAFNIELQDYHVDRSAGRLPFRAHTAAPTVPDHLEPIILNVFKLHTIPPNAPPTGYLEPPIQSAQTVSFFNTIYAAPTTVSGASQHVAIGQFTGWGSWTLSDINATRSHYSITSSINISTITIDDITPGSSAEATLDLAMVGLFGGGANVVFYQATTPEEIVSRVVFPDPGESQCNIISFSYAGGEAEFSTDLTTWEDAAMNGITICASSGDWGTTDAFANITALFPAVCPYVTGVGGTTVGAQTGTFSTTDFVEWVWNDQQTYYNVTGGGVSIQFAKPSYQNVVTIPATLTPGTSSLPAGVTGRGEPDIAAMADQTAFVSIFFNGVLVQSGGTSGSCPMVAGILARVNATLGYNVGFINPTLYHGRGAFIRALSSGGAPDNAMIQADNTGSTVIAGYPTTTTAGAWCACTGLGVLLFNSFISYIQGRTKTLWIEVDATNEAGTSTSEVSGPFYVVG